jgi:hypothetical protein
MSAMTPKMPGTYRQKAVGQKMHLNIRPLLFELGAAHTAHLWLGQPLKKNLVLVADRAERRANVIEKTATFRIS